MGEAGYGGRRRRRFTLPGFGYDEKALRKSCQNGAEEV